MNAVNIIVCVKQIADPEGPPSAFKVAPEGNRVTVTGIPPVISPFDENALEAAMCIKDIHQCKITVISLGRNLAKAVLRKSLAVGGDELLLLEDEVFEDLDSYSTALTLATAIKKIGEYDLIFTGRQAADWDAGQVGSGIAEILGIPSVTIARKVELSDSKVRVERVVSDGYEVIEAPMPALITVSNELGDLRTVNLRNLMAAQKKPVTVWKAEDLGIDPSQMRRSTLLRLSTPPAREARCESIEGQTPEEKGANLALKLREAKIV